MNVFVKNKFAAGMAALALTLAPVFTGCDTGTNGEGFVAVTGISGVPTVAITGVDLTLRGTVEPSNATNRTIVWSGANVSGGKLNVTYNGPEEKTTVTVTATIANGASESSAYTRNFDIEAYAVGTSNDNPFGDDTTPFAWAMNDKGGKVYVQVEDDEWTSFDEGKTYNRGGYTWDGVSKKKYGISTVDEGKYAGDTGLAILKNDGTLLVANFLYNSDMNGTFTKLDTGLTFEGTWISTEAVPHYNDYAKFVAESNGTFVMYISHDGVNNWKLKMKGTYPTSTATNPATIVLTDVKANHDNDSEPWTTWTGEPQTFEACIYDDRIEGMGLVFNKESQP